MECSLSSLVYSYKIVYRDNMYIIANFFGDFACFFCLSWGWCWVVIWGEIVNFVG